MQLSEKLKILRRNKRQTLQEIADSVGVSKSYVCELENGTSKNPGFKLLVKLATHFGVTIEFLADEETEPKDAAALEFFHEYHDKLSPEDWMALKAMASRLKNN